MTFRVSDDGNDIWYSDEDTIIIPIKDFDILIDNNIEEIMFLLLKEDEIIRYIKLPDNVIKEIVDLIISGESEKRIVDILNKHHIYYFSFAISTVNTYRRRYKYLKYLFEGQDIIISYHEENIDKAIRLGNYLKGDVVLDNTSIPLNRYKEILERYRTFDFDKSHIKFYYQENNNPVTSSDLYKASILVNDIAMKVKMADLSPMESIMYLYDVVKARLYKKDYQNYHNSCDVLAVLSGDYIVCSGYSNIFNAVLKTLGIKACPLISWDVNHQRSIVYVKDDKYNIDGVYIFDPTWDRKMDDKDKEYIHRYNYFAMPLNISNISAPDSMSKVLKVDYRNLILYKEKIVGAKQIEILNIVDDAYSFVFNKRIPYHEDLNENDVDNIYYGIQEKYCIKDIDPLVFAKILYTNRKAQDNDVNIEEVKKAVVDRYSSFEMYKLHAFADKRDARLRLILYEAKLSQMLDDFFGEEVMKENKARKKRLTSK